MARHNRVEYKFGKKDKNNASFGRFLMSEQVMDPTREIADSMMRQAISLSPESNDAQGVPYKNQFKVREKRQGLMAGKGPYRNRRVAVEVINTADHAPAIEFGLKDEDSGGPRPARRVLLRAGLIVRPNQRRKK